MLSYQCTDGGPLRPSQTRPNGSLRVLARSTFSRQSSQPMQPQYSEKIKVETAMAGTRNCAGLNALPARSRPPILRKVAADVNACLCGLRSIYLRNYQFIACVGLQWVFAI
jgi:hypothetical protein